MGCDSQWDDMPSYAYDPPIRKSEIESLKEDLQKLRAAVNSFAVDQGGLTDDENSRIVRALEQIGEEREIIESALRSLTAACTEIENILYK